MNLPKLRPAGSCMISQVALSIWNQFQSLLNNGTPTVGLIYVCPVILYCGASRMHSSKAAVVNTLSEPLRCPLLILLSAISVSKETWPLCMHKKLQCCHCEFGWGRRLSIVSVWPGFFPPLVIFSIPITNSVIFKIK